MAIRSTPFIRAWRRSAELVPAWRSAVARGVRRREVQDVPAFTDAARDIGLARLDAGGIPTSRRSLDRLMEQAYQLYAARKRRRVLRQFVFAYRGLPPAGSTFIKIA